MESKEIIKEDLPVISGSIRISILSQTLLRVEERGYDGFEDRETFLVTKRDWPPVSFELTYKDNFIHLKTSGYMILLEKEARHISDVKVYDVKGENLLWDGSKAIYDTTPLPQRGEQIYVLPDNPRIIPPPWGALPPPDIFKKDNLSGWLSGQDVKDLYIFVYNGDLSSLRKEFLKLTGSIPIPPLWTFGFWNSLYHPYTDTEALEVIERYRNEGIPLDVFVVDTDWRVGGSSGYDIEKKYFPDIESFFEKSHSYNVKIVMNDHPGARGMKPVDPNQLKYRYDNLTKILSMGLDTWWYDKNWHEFIEGPDLGKEIWGQYLYSGIISHFRPGLRTVLLSMWSDHHGSHRYPLWWTGDIHSSWDDLRDGIRETLWFGQQCMPYVGQDLGGHVGDPDDELYTRFLQYGCLSPTARVHGTIKAKRYPWLYSAETQEIVTEYIKLRYRLLPTIYSAARKAYEEGLPLLRSPLIEWPEYNESNNYLEYLLGDDLLVAPVYTQAGYTRIDERFLSIDNNEQTGLKGEYFSNSELSGEPLLTRMDREISFPPWFREPLPDPGEKFSVRWSGRIFIEEKGTYTFRTLSSDGVRLWVDNKLIIDNWTAHHQTYDSADIELEPGYVPFRLEFFNNKGFWIIRLDWITPSHRIEKPLHKLWIPPGEWEDLWTGEIFCGPAVLSVKCPIYKIPMFVRRGAIVILSPEMDYTGQKSWDQLTLEIFPQKGKNIIRTLYEDDGITLEYQSGGFRKTELFVSGDEKKICVILEKPCGIFRGSGKYRNWFVRIHLTQGERPESVFIDGRKPGKKEYSIFAGEAVSWPWIPLKGNGSIPPEKAGIVIELSLPYKYDKHEIVVHTRC